MRLLEQEKLIEHMARQAYFGTISLQYAHDMSNLLNRMTAHLSVLEQEVPSGSRAATILDEAIGDADRMCQELKSLLNLTQLTVSAGRDKTIETLEQCVTRATRTLSRKATGLQIHLTTRVMDNVADVKVPVDFGFVLTILISNALEALNMVHHRKRDLTVDAWQETTYVILSVYDNGVGILPEHLDMIFTLGFTTKPTSIGASLYVAKRVVERYGGRIHAQSKLGEYTRFTITIPVELGSADEKNTVVR